MKSMFSPTYQVRVSRLYQSCMLPTSSSTSPLGPRPQSPAPELSGHCRTSTADRHQLRKPDLSGKCGTSIASARRHIEYQIESLIKCQNMCQIKMSNRMPDRMRENMSDKISDRMPDRLPEYMSGRMSVGGDHSKKVIDTMW